MTRAAILILILSSPALAPPARDASRAATTFAAELHAKPGADPAAMFDRHVAPLVAVADLSAKLHKYELRHGEGCRAPKRKCSCGLSRKLGELRAALAEWDRGRR